MSIHHQQVILKDPFQRLSPERQQAFLAMVKGLLSDSPKCKLEIDDSPIFFDCGGSLEYVRCPFCKADLDTVWNDWMQRWYEGDHNQLGIETPCCSKLTTLNDLDYKSPQGFACVGVRSEWELIEISANDLEEIGAHIGAPVRLIWQHI